MKSPGKYVPMTKRMPPKGGNIPGAAGLFPRVRVGCGLIRIPEEGELS